jgi:uncharacterized Zn finger protein (UPF0148 family)
MPLQGLNCPNCGAPLADSRSGVQLCIYCNTFVRVPPAAEPGPVTVEKTVSDEALAPIKQLLAAGSRDEAVQRYRELAGCTLEEAQAALDTLARQLAFATIASQQLTRFGVLVVVLSVLALAAALAGWAAGTLHPLIALLFAAFAALQLFVFSNGILATLRYARAPRAQAETLHFVRIGQVALRNQRVTVFRVWLEVRPAGAPPFRTEITLPVREAHLANLHEGAMLQVKYLPGDPSSVIFDQTTAAKR